jgi:hypothetical protein
MRSQITRQEIRQSLGPNLILQIPRTQIHPAGIQPSLLDGERLLIEDLVDETDRNLLTGRRLGAVVGPVPELTTRDLGSSAV